MGYDTPCRACRRHPGTAVQTVSLSAVHPHDPPSPARLSAHLRCPHALWRYSKRWMANWGEWHLVRLKQLLSPIYRCARDKLGRKGWREMKAGSGCSKGLMDGRVASGVCGWMLSRVLAGGQCLFPAHYLDPSLFWIVPVVLPRLSLPSILRPAHGSLLLPRVISALSPAHE